MKKHLSLAFFSRKNKTLRAKETTPKFNWIMAHFAVTMEIWPSPLVILGFQNPSMKSTVSSCSACPAPMCTTRSGGRSNFGSASRASSDQNSTLQTFETKKTFRNIQKLLVKAKLKWEKNRCCLF